MRFVVSALALVSVLGFPTPALAQPASGTVFISAGGFAAVEKSPTTRGFGVPESDSSGTVAGGGLGIGVHLTERVTARFEWSLTDTLTQSGGVITYPAYPLEVLTVFSGANAGRARDAQATALTVPYAPETRRSTAAGFALLGYHLPAGRASIELLGGVGLLNQDVESSYDVRIANAPAGLSLPALPAYKSSSYHAVAVVGADVAVALASHAAIVPQVRVYAHQGHMSIRPGLALRWTF